MSSIKGFQVIFGSRMHNGDENPAEIYYSNGGELNLDTNRISLTYSLQLDVNPDKHFPELPADAYRSGSGGYVIYLVPALDLVVFKLGGRDE